MKPKVLVMGENADNGRIAQTLGAAGNEVVVLDSLDDIRCLEGEVCGFSAQLAGGGALAADFVVFTQTPGTEPPAIAGGLPRWLYEPNKAGFVAGIPQGTPLLFLLDYNCESPLAATVRALEEATALALKKRRVYYAARFVRTAGRDVEQAYAKAREAGVTFIKYTKIDFAYDKPADRFDVRATDGVLQYEIPGALVFADGGRAVGEDFEQAAAKLRLHADEQGYLLEDKHFLAPALTSRRGVFCIGRDLRAERLDEGLAFIAAAIARLAPAPGADVPKAQVEGEKCVFCYTCYRACTHAALRPDKEARKMQPLQDACEGCGTCVSVCPGNAVTLEGVRGEEAPPNKDAMLYGRLLVYACENGAALSMQLVLDELDDLMADEVDVKEIPCGGSLGLEELADALLRYEKVLVATCPDDACKHFEGTARARLQSERLTDMLAAAGLPGGRVAFVQASHAQPFMLRDAIVEFAGRELAAQPEVSE